MTDTRAYWEAQAATFDDEPDHGLADPATREAWRALLLDSLPSAPADVVDVGCGTGTLSVLLAEQGYSVRAFDLAANMVVAARAKAVDAGVQVEFQQGDAADPPYDPRSADAVISRHVLWVMPDPGETLARWVSLLRPGGTVLLVEGRWFTGGGIPADECERLLADRTGSVQVKLLDDPVYWGRPIDDERYLAVGRRVD